MEVEAKFTIPDEETVQRLETATRLAGYDVDTGERRADRDTFWDTPSRRFAAHGYYLRRRETTDGVRLTLKKLPTVDDVVMRREELEALVAADVPVEEWPAGPLRERVEEIAGGEPLEPLLTLTQERFARCVRADGREVAELSIDRVCVSAADGDHVWYEAEAEARGEGTEDDVLSLAAELSVEWPLVPEKRSKFERALALLADGERRLIPVAERVHHERMAAVEGVRARRAVALLALDEGLPQTQAGARAGMSARRVRYWLARYRVEGLSIYGPAEEESVVVAEDAPAEPVEEPERKPALVRADDSMTEAAAKTLRLHFARMLEHEDGTREGADSEELHVMRVSTRRMRMALRVFAEYLDPSTVRPVLKGLRRTGRVLGAVRDLDVFLEKTQVYLDGLPAGRANELRDLLDAWRVEHARQREHLVAYLDSGRYRSFVEETGELLGGPVARLAPARSNAPRPQRVAQVLPGVLYQDMATVWAFEGQLGGVETPLPGFHALRKACKGLRYTLEFFEDVLGPGARPLIKTVKGLQNHLGDLQDAVVTCGILRDYITWGSWRHHGHSLPGPAEVIVAPGAARYLAARQDEMERLILTFPEVWEALAGSGFSRSLATVIAEI